MAASALSAKRPTAAHHRYTCGQEQRRAAGGARTHSLSALAQKPRRRERPATSDTSVCASSAAWQPASRPAAGGRSSTHHNHAPVLGWHPRCVELGLGPRERDAGHSPPGLKPQKARDAKACGLGAGCGRLVPPSCQDRARNRAHGERRALCEAVPRASLLPGGQAGAGLPGALTIAKPAKIKSSTPPTPQQLQVQHSSMLSAMVAAMLAPATM